MRLVSWLDRSLGREKAISDPRALLAEAMSDIGGTLLAERAIAFFDAPKDFTEYAIDVRTEPLWVLEDREPAPDELASEIFISLLLAEDRLGCVDWADGYEKVAAVFDSLLSHAKVAVLQADERNALAAKAASAARGEAFLQLWPLLEGQAKRRGLEFVYVNLGQDAHFILLMSPEAKKRWSQARFGKGFPVLP